MLSLHKYPRIYHSYHIHNHYITNQLQLLSYRYYLLFNLIFTMFNCQKYDSNDLESVLRHNVHAKSAYSAVLVDKCLNVVLSDLILHSMETINIAQAQCERETNILSRDINGFKFHENAKTWFSHILDQDESPTYEDEYF